MPNEVTGGRGLADFAVEKARAALRNGDAQGALQWLERVSVRDRPSILEAEVRYSVARDFASRREWRPCERELEAARRLDANPFYEQRLALVRQREVLLENAKWRTMRGKVDPARRLPSDHLSPLVSGVWACGAYHSRGRGRGLPWSHLLREAKNPPSDEAQRRAILKLACGYLCRYILEVTGVLRHADVVVAVPPDPGRYVERAMSLPDEVAIAIEQQLALPRSPEALVKRKSVELRGLSWGDRRRIVAGSMAARDVKLVRSRCVLVVDDVMTSGATLSEAARVLRDAGARDVHGVVLCHTEG